MIRRIPAPLPLAGASATVGMAGQARHTSRVGTTQAAARPTQASASPWVISSGTRVAENSTPRPTPAKIQVVPRLRMDSGNWEAISDGAITIRKAPVTPATKRHRLNHHTGAAQALARKPRPTSSTDALITRVGPNQRLTRLASTAPTR